MEATQLKEATSRAIEMSLSNIRFEAGNVYQLPFGDDSFDAIFAHALLEHLSEPVGALKEMFRVLKKGGIIGVRSGNLSRHLIEPSNSVLESALDLYYRFRQYGLPPISLTPQLA
jgi:ubiquinone/menaquinone biosynthesis C-methylase UbiE